MRREYHAALVLVLVLLCSTGLASAKREPLQLLLPVFSTEAGNSQLLPITSFIDELFRSMQFAAHLGEERSVQSAPSQCTAFVSYSSSYDITSNGFTASSSVSFNGTVARDQVMGLAVNGTASSSTAPEVDPVVPEGAVLNADGTYYVKNDVCTERPAHTIEFYDQIISIPDDGEVVCPAAFDLEGMCQHLAYDDGQLSVSAFMYALDEDGTVVVPVYVETSIDINEPVEYHMTNTMYFSAYDINVTLEEEDFQAPSSCNRAFYEPCEAVADPAVLELYYFSAMLPSDGIALSDDSAADVYGAAAGLCENIFLTQRNDTIGYLSKFSIMLDRNFDMMHAKNSVGYVQHSGAYLFGESDYAGQCSDNAGIGNWYYFPAEGLCEDGQTVGDSPCYWEAAFNITTVPITCFLDSGIQPVCADEYQLPFSSAAAVLDAVFASGQSEGCTPLVSAPTADTPTDDGNDNSGNGDNSNDGGSTGDDGWLWLAAIFTVGCICLVVIVVAVALAAYKFRDRLMEIPAFAMLARQPHPDSDHDSSEWKTLSEGGSNGLLDGDLLDDDDLDLTFD